MTIILNNLKESILYTFRRCPYAIRARWALSSVNHNVICREVSLKDKPKELIETSKKATVPVLITPDMNIVDESLDIIHWSLNISNRMDISRIEDKAKNKNIYEIIHRNDKEFKYYLDAYKYNSRYKNIDKEFANLKAREILLDLNSMIEFNTSNKNPGFIIDSKESLADWAIWPFIRQYRLVNPSKLDDDKELESLKIWLFYFLEHPLYKQIMKKNDPWAPDQEPIYLLAS